MRHWLPRNGTDGTTADREIARIKAEFGERLPRTMFMMTLPEREDRDH